MQNGSYDCLSDDNPRLLFSGKLESSTPTCNKTEPSGGDKASFRLGYHSPQKEEM